MQMNPYDPSSHGMLEYDGQEPMDVFYPAQSTFMHQPVSLFLVPCQHFRLNRLNFS